MVSSVYLFHLQFPLLPSPLFWDCVNVVENKWMMMMNTSNQTGSYADDRVTRFTQQKKQLFLFLTLLGLKKEKKKKHPEKGGILPLLLPSPPPEAVVAPNYCKIAFHFPLIFIDLFFLFDLKGKNIFDWNVKKLILGFLFVW